MRLIRLAALAADERRGSPAFDSIVEQYHRILIAAPSSDSPVRFTVGIAALLLVGGAFIPSGVPYWAFVAIVIFLGGFQAYHRVRESNRTHNNALVKLLCGNGLCAACAHPLSPHAYGSDPMLTCTECGARWRADRVHSRHEFATTEAARRSRIAASRLHRILGTKNTLGPTSTIDAVGVRRPLVSPNLGYRVAVVTGEVQDRLVAAREEMLRHGRVSRLVRSLVILAIFAFGTISLLRGASSGGTISPIGLLVLICLGILMPISTLRGYSGIRERHVRDAMLRRDLCPSCAADLSTVDPDPVRGGRICPECQAAWGHSASLSPPLDCRHCRYPVANLTPDARGHVICPECGRATPITPHALALERVRCADCGGSLAGKALNDRGAVRCDRCGQWTRKFTQHELDMAGEAAALASNE